MPLAPPVTSAFLPSSLTLRAGRDHIAAEGVVDCAAVAEAIPIIGGTGALGYGLGLRWALAGHPVVIGSRDAERAAETARKISEQAPDAVVEGMENPKAAKQGPWSCWRFPSARSRRT